VINSNVNSNSQEYSYIQMIYSKTKLTPKHLAFTYTLKQLLSNYFKCNHKTNI